MKKLILLGIAISLPLSIWALTLTQTGAEIAVSYQEPTTNTDGSPLNDLDHTNLYIENVGQGVNVATIPATSPTGGGTINRTITVPIGPGQEGTIRGWATATDDNGNMSPSSSTDTITVDRLAPAAPQ